MIRLGRPSAMASGTETDETTVHKGIVRLRIHAL